MRSCRSNAARRVAADRRSRLARVRRLAAARGERLRTLCTLRHGKIPGPVRALTVRAAGSRSLRLTFRVAGTDGFKAPAATNYLIKQSERPIRTARDFRRATALCKGACSFDVTSTDATARLTVVGLRRKRTYHYAVAARDNVSGRPGPRSATVAGRAG